MSNLRVLMLTAVIAVLGVVTGLVANVWWTRRAAKARRRIPGHWPLEPRTMANAEECKIWRWLIRVFSDHYVMTKVPVTRFTFPRGNEDSMRWFELLSGVYCTFTVCGPDGNVVGCVDVPGRKGMSRSNQKLKLSLLSQCGIAYWVLKPGNLPKVVDIRKDFLGDSVRKPSKEYMDEVAVTTAQQKLRESIERQRHRRMSESALASVDESHSDDSFEIIISDTDLGPSAWQQLNSFIAPLNSRAGALR